MRNKWKNQTNKNTTFINIKKNIYTIILIIIIALISAYIIWFKKKNDIKVSETTKGDFQIYTETKAYVLNRETIINYNKNETLIPIAESEKRVTIGNIIGIYKNEEYDNKNSKLVLMDEEINEKLALLPEIYSNEVITIEKEIYEVTKEIKNINSYIQMNDYKSRLDTLAYEKALTISKLTPSGNDVKNLIEKRDEYRNGMNKSSNNVKASVSGVVMYKVDGLENKFEFKDLEKLPLEAIEKIMEEYNKTHEESFGIKIVDNYESYILFKEDKSNDKYIKENGVYNIEILDKNTKIKGTLIKKIESEKENLCIFKITNKIEEIIDLRTVDIKVIWQELYGFVVNTNSIKTINNIEYVTIISLQRYLDIPVKVLLKLDNISLVKNYTMEEKKELGLPTVGTLETYDRIVENK